LEASSSSPFQRARTWVPDGGNTTIGGLSGGHELERVKSEPIGSAQPNRHFSFFEAGTKEQDVEEAAIETQSNRRPESAEQKARQRFVSRWFMKKLKETTTESAREDRSKGKKEGKRKRFTVWSQLRATLFNSWFNILLLAVPAGFVVNYLHLNPIAIFFVNFGAILPLTTLFSYAIDEVRLRLKGVSGMLVYMSFG
jgi:Ca2+:H+ antiporter